MASKRQQTHMPRGLRMRSYRGPLGPNAPGLFSFPPRILRFYSHRLSSKGALNRCKFDRSGFTSVSGHGSTNTTVGLELPYSNLALAQGF